MLEVYNPRDYLTPELAINANPNKVEIISDLILEMREMTARDLADGEVPTSDIDAWNDEVRSLIEDLEDLRDNKLPNTLLAGGGTVHDAIDGAIERLDGGAIHGSGTLMDRGGDVDDAAQVLETMFRAIVKNAGSFLSAQSTGEKPHE